MKTSKTLLFVILLFQFSLNSQDVVGVIEHSTIEGMCNDGSINLNITGGYPPYDVEWFREGQSFYLASGIQGTNDGEDISNLEGQQITGIEYTVIISDAICGTIELDFSVRCLCERCELNVEERTNPSCNESGYVRMQFSQNCVFTYPFEFEWSDGSTSGFERDDLGLGTYCLTVTNRYECEYYGCVNMEGPPNFLDIYMNDYQNVSSCSQSSNSNDGYIDLEINSSNGPVSYNWSNGSTSQDINNLDTGIYSVTVTDSAGCQNELSIEICCCSGAQPSNSNCNSNGFWQNLTDHLTIEGNVNHELNGSIRNITTAVSGGTGNYVCTWTGPTGYISSSCAGLGGNLEIGRYCLKVDDGCDEVEECFDIVDCDLYELNITGTVSHTCPNENAGSISTNSNGGPVPFTYSWSTGANSSSIDMLGTGTYCVTVTDKNGCSDSECFTVLDTNTIEVDVRGCTAFYECNGQEVDFYEIPQREQYLGECVMGIFCGDLQLGSYPLVEEITELGCGVFVSCVLDDGLPDGYYIPGELVVKHFNKGEFDRAKNCWWCHTLHYCYIPKYNLVLESTIDLFNHLFVTTNCGAQNENSCNEGEQYECVFCPITEQESSLIWEGCKDYLDANEPCDKDDLDLSPNISIEYEEYQAKEYINGEYVDVTKFNVKSFDRAAVVDYLKTYEEVNVLESSKESKTVNREVLPNRYVSSKAQFSIYPNPSVDILNIKLNDISNSEYELSIINGINSESINLTNHLLRYDENMITLNITNLNQGIYFIGFRNKSGHITEFQKFVKL